MSSTASTEQTRGASCDKPRSRNPYTWLTENTLAGMARRKALMGYLFVLPTILGILVFTAGPVLFSFVLSLFRWNVFSPPEWIGLVNYQRMFTDSRALIWLLELVHFCRLWRSACRCCWGCCWR